MKYERTLLLALTCLIFTQLLFSPLFGGSPFVRLLLTGDRSKVETNSIVWVNQQTETIDTTANSVQAGVKRKIDCQEKKIKIKSL